MSLCVSKQQAENDPSTKIDLLRQPISIPFQNCIDQNDYKAHTAKIFEDTDDLKCITVHEHTSKYQYLITIWKFNKNTSKMIKTKSIKYITYEVEAIESTENDTELDKSLIFIEPNGNHLAVLFQLSSFQIIDINIHKNGSNVYASHDKLIKVPIKDDDDIWYGSFYFKWLSNERILEIIYETQHFKVDYKSEKLNAFIGPYAWESMKYNTIIGGGGEHYFKIMKNPEGKCEYYMDITIFNEKDNGSCWISDDILRYGYKKEYTWYEWPWMIEDPRALQ